MICLNPVDHTPSPEGYLQWHAWAAQMAKTHTQRKCPECGLYEVWEPKSAALRAQAPAEIGEQA